MATLFEFSQTLSKFNKENNSSATLKFFKENKEEFTTDQIASNRYIVYEMIYALIETNHHAAIFDFIKQHNAVLDPKSFPYLLKKLKKNN